MSHFNQTILIGNLGKDPEILKTTDLGNFVRLSLATTKRYKDKNGEKQTDTQWHVIYLNNRLGKIAACYLRKGDKIFISGELRTREWFDDQGGRHLQTSVYAKELKFVNVKPLEEINIPNETIRKDDSYTNAIQEIRNVLGDHIS